jgi:hypothetical protein
MVWDHTPPPRGSGSAIGPEAVGLLASGPGRPGRLGIRLPDHLVQAPGPCPRWRCAGIPARVPGRRRHRWCADGPRRWWVETREPKTGSSLYSREGMIHMSTPCSLMRRGRTRSRRRLSHSCWTIGLLPQRAEGPFLGRQACTARCRGQGRRKEEEKEGEQASPESRANGVEHVPNHETPRAWAMETNRRGGTYRRLRPCARRR